MSEMVRFEKEGNIGFIIVNNPPVNAIAQAVRHASEKTVAAGGAR
jgi:hypothetical protein